MLYEKRIGERQWQKVYGYLQAFSEIYVRNEEACRRGVLDASLRRTMADAT